MKRLLTDIKRLTTRSWVWISAAGLVTMLVVYILDAALAWSGHPAESTLFDDVLLGIAVALLMLFLEIQHARELRDHTEKLAVMMQMNHHIRNALQTIVYANSHNTNPDSAGEITEAVTRIEWALREVLQFKSTAGDQERPRNGGTLTAGAASRTSSLPADRVDSKTFPK